MRSWQRAATAGLLVTVLLFTLLPSTASPVSPEIGHYLQFGLAGTLTENDSEATEDGLQVDGPWMSSSLKVDLGWLDEQLGAWGATSAFEIDASARAVFAGQQAVFKRFELDHEPVFTRGSNESILFTDRPMWLSVDSLGNETYELDMEDGDSSGQPITLQRAWLWSLGIHWPKVVHEDGTVLAAELTEDGNAFSVQIPHFSIVILQPDGLSVKTRVNGLMLDHEGEKRWYPESNLLEIDMAPSPVEVELLVEKAWVDQNIVEYPYSTYTFAVVAVHGIDYYSTILASHSEAAIVVDLSGPLPETFPSLPGILRIVDLGVANFSSSGGGDDCPYEMPNSNLPLTYIGTTDHSWTGASTGSVYYKEAAACYGTSGDSAFVYWKLQKTNRDGASLAHDSITNNCDPELPPDSWIGDRAYCVRVTNAGYEDVGVRMRARQPTDTSFEGSCFNTALTLGYEGSGITISHDMCYLDIIRQAEDGLEARWAVKRSTSGTHSSGRFYFGVAQEVPIASDGSVETKIQLHMRTNFHGADGAWGLEPWSVTATVANAGSVDFLPVVMGDQSYEYSDAISIVEAADQDARNALGVTLMGAKLLEREGADTAAVASAMLDADLILEAQSGRLPFDPAYDPLTPEEETNIFAIRQALLDGLVTEVIHAS